MPTMSALFKKEKMKSENNLNIILVVENVFKSDFEYLLRIWY